MKEDIQGQDRVARVSDRCFLDVIEHSLYKLGMA